MRLMEGEHVGPFNLGNPGEFTMLELAQVCHASICRRCMELFLINIHIIFQTCQLFTHLVLYSFAKCIPGNYHLLILIE